MSNVIFKENKFTWKGQLYLSYGLILLLFFSFLMVGAFSSGLSLSLILAGCVYLWKLGRDKTIYTLTDEAVHVEMGILNKTTKKTPLKKIQDVILKQSFIQKQFNVGDLFLESAGESGGLPIQDVLSPQEKMEKILDLIHKKNNE